MKAFLHRLHLGGTKDKDKDKDKDKQNPSPALHKEKFPPLRTWPPPSEEPQRITSIASTYASFKPLPEIIPAQISSPLSSRPLPPIEEPTAPVPSSSSPLPPLPPSITPSTSTSTSATAPTPSTSSHAPQTPSHPTDNSSATRVEPDSAGRSSRKATAASVNTSLATTDVQKKVAFISPPPTPVNLDRALPDSPSIAPSTPALPSSAPLKTTVSRFQATHGKETRGLSSAGASSSKTDLSSSGKSATVKATSTRTASPPPNRLDTPGSIRSITPYSQMSQGSGSRILAAQSWSEVAEEDLVSNIGSRERTRQEVLFEIISSEERYVHELVKMKDTFIDPLLHPFSSAPTPLSSTPNLDYEYYRVDSPIDSVDQLPPIAARFMSPTPTSPTPGSGPTSIRNKDTPNIDGESLDTDDDDDDAGRPGITSPASKHNHPRSPYRQAASRGRPGPTVPFPSPSTQSLGRQSTIMENPRERNYSQGQSTAPDRKEAATPKPAMLRKLKKSQTSGESPFGPGIAPHQLPEDLRICLEVVDSGVLDGHKRLSEALKKRYDDQYPLVRSLADVFVSNSDIFQGYAKYVLHLERALEQVDDALSNVSTKKPKKQDAAEWQKVCKVLQRLEESASDKGETGLAITLSKPFQRLLKYPLLFQNLLFHTDPSTFEYESTLQMVAEIESIVRSIEDEKIQKEERDKTRDVFARIEGLDKVRQLALPKPSRVLLEERVYMTNSGLNPLSASTKGSSPPPVVNTKGVRGKSSFKRLSDVLQGGNGIGGKKDLWLVAFNDVVLQCQRTGTTSLPLVAATNSRTNSLPELQGKAKYATTGRRNSQTKPRNLYKFIKIETWAIGDVAQPREGVVSMEDVARSRTLYHNQPRIVPMPEDDDENGAESDDSDRKSKMSFSYWGADKVTVQKPMVKGRLASQTRRGASPASYGRESSANAKFGTRLVSGEGSPNPRPASRRAATTPVSRRAAPSAPPAPSEEGTNYNRATITRPAWDTSTRSPVVAPTPKRARNTSQTSSAVRATTTSPTMNSMLATPPHKGLASPAPSEDSGVGLYRQMLANDPNLTNV
ncbi:Dbl homology domain-containing protein [Pluteus cervinus]|uniref:Dbl homology domain-containing protein n=1 Tax=Pluteus cervinus TaxID=181527 RepID=A0ACD3BF71_9AGAR|nr:Dbl homology domain-containing protein [Pluteus cervinus]